MNMKADDIEKWFEQFNAANSVALENKVVIICPSFPYLEKAKSLIRTKNTFVGAQDLDVFDKGAHTGSVGIFQLSDFCTYSIVGHSELKESEENTLLKRDKCLSASITPIVCFVDPEKATAVEKDTSLIAWEDPQNISVNGVYRAKDPQEIRQSVQAIKSTINENTQLIYGGSVNKDNISDLANIKEINGVLVGNASLDPTHFLYIIENA